MRRVSVLAALAVVGSVALGGCAPVRQIRVENISTRQITDLSIAGQPYGDFAPGEIGEYQRVKLKFRYATLKMYIDGRYTTAQTLNFGSKRFTYRVDVKDFDKGHLKIELVREREKEGVDDAD